MISLPTSQINESPHSNATRQQGQTNLTVSIIIESGGKGMVLVNKVVMLYLFAWCGRRSAHRLVGGDLGLLI